MLLKKTLLATILGCSIALGSLVTVHAEPGNSPLQSTMQAYLITVSENGKEVAQATKEVEPGQIVEYRMEYKNAGKTPLKGIAVTGPVPSSTQYMSNTAHTQTDADFTVSIDGGKTFENEPVKRLVVNEQGKKVEKIIPPSEYTHVRWILKQPLSTGDTQLFTYRTLVK